MEKIKNNIFTHKILPIISIFIFCLFNILITNVNASSLLSETDVINILNKTDISSYLHTRIESGGTDLTSNLEGYFVYSISDTEYYIVVTDNPFIVGKNYALKSNGSMPVANSVRIKVLFNEDNTYTHSIVNTTSQPFTIDTGSITFIYSTDNIVYESDTSNIFFQKTPQVAITLTEIAKVEELPKMITKTMKVIIPVGLVVLSMVLLISLIRSVILRVK